jgi:hypothetical protein
VGHEPELLAALGGGRLAVGQNPQDRAPYTVDDEFAAGDGGRMDRNQAAFGISATDDRLAASVASSMYGA